MSSAMDRNDPEFVRELARKHWDAINSAAATGGDVTAAFRPQEEFLTKYIPSLPPDVAKTVSDAYSQESAVHAAQLKRISDGQLHKAKRVAVTAKRMKQNAIIFAAIMVLLLIFKVAAMLGAV